MRNKLKFRLDIRSCEGIVLGFVGVAYALSRTVLSPIFFTGKFLK